MRVSIAVASTLGAAAALGNALYPRQSGSAQYTLQKGPLDTPWTETVGTDPWPEYPRPRLQRALWKNLNGVWRWRNASSGEVSTPPTGQTLERQVLIPSCLESALSGIMENGHLYSWFQTSFDVPPNWPIGDRVLLNFGAVDYEATVFVNGKEVGFHRGGYFEFSFDVTDYLSATGSNELLVHVYDPTDTDRNQIPLGKQTLVRNEMIWYTPCTGIWQTVFLESTPSEHVSKLDLAADMDGNVNVTVHSSTNSASTEYRITIYEPNSSNTVKKTATGTSGAPFIFEVDSPDLWTPDTPVLYNITVELGSDIIESYTGFRTVSRGVVDGVQRPLLNGKFIFPFGTLDQGYWPDGIYTAPSVEAMIYDLQKLKEVGYNTVRKHIKVEPALYYKACDEMGMLVIQDMPSLRPDLPDPNNNCGSIRLEGPEEQKEFNRQLGLLVEQLKSYTSIYAWTIYNEEWGQSSDPNKPWPEFELTEVVRSLDPTRLINAVSGWTDHTAGDFDDNHHYSTPQCGSPFWSNSGGYNSAYDPTRIGIQGEFGGIGQQVAFENSWFKYISGQTSYELTNTTEAWNYRCLQNIKQLREQVEMYACSGGIWTQTTDVEGEVNGMLTYDRRINRMDKGLWQKELKALYDAAARRQNVTVMVDGLVGIGEIQKPMQ